MAKSGGAFIVAVHAIALKRSGADRSIDRGTEHVTLFSLFTCLLSAVANRAPSPNAISPVTIS